MSEKLFRFLMDELKTVRVHCKACGGTVELEITKLDSRFLANHCPLCNVDLEWSKAPHDYNPFKELGKLARYFQGIKDKAQVEFTLPDKS